MDKLTKGFVIAACSVVVATPIVWLAGQVLEARRQAEIRAQELEDQAERNRKVSRVIPCKERADALFPTPTHLDINSTMSQISLRSKFLTRCTDSTKPVAMVSKKA